MTDKEFIDQQISAGYKIHFNEGVWWQRRHPLFCKPAHFLQEIKPGESKPKMSKSLLGYSHLVNDNKLANKFWSVMILSDEKLNEFSIEKLPNTKRRRIRKGLKLTKVKRIESIEPVLEDIQNICISQAKRTLHGLPPEYYSNNFDNWKSYITREFALPNREWWGVFYNGKLIAYRNDVLLNDTMYFLTTKSHSEFLDKCPNDALMYTFIDYCQSLDGCRRLNAGDWNEERETINNFKELFGFQKIDLPVYAHFNPLVKLSKKIKRLFH